MNTFADIRKTSTPSLGADVFSFEESNSASPVPQKQDRKKIFIFEADDSIRQLLQTWAQSLGLEVQALAAPSLCHLHTNPETPCPLTTPCCQLMLVDNHFVNNEGLNLLQRQDLMACPLGPNRKAILSTVRFRTDSRKIEELGCRNFNKPLRLRELTEWALAQTTEAKAEDAAQRVSCLAAPLNARC